MSSYFSSEVANSFLIVSTYWHHNTGQQCHGAELLLDLGEMVPPLTASAGWAIANGGISLEGSGMLQSRAMSTWLTLTEVHGPC
jgi:hypothetical protein